MNPSHQLCERELALKSIIERHLPSSSTLYPGAKTIDDELNCRSAFYAQRLLFANDEPLRPFGLGAPPEKWETVRRAAKELKSSLLSVGLQGVREVGWSAPLWWDRDHPLGFEAYLVSGLVEEAASKRQELSKSLLPAGKKRDWRAAAIAKEARHIWAEQEWADNPKVYGQVPPNELSEIFLPTSDRVSARQQQIAYSKHLEDFAPRSDKHDGPGPFGRFLNDILQTLSVSCSSASALRSLSDANKLLKRR